MLIFHSVTSLLLILLLSWLLGRLITLCIPQQLVVPRCYLALPCGLVTFLALFATLSSQISSYGVTISLIVGITLTGNWVLRHRISSISEDFRSSAICFALFFSVAGILVFLHSMWPEIHWENSANKAGVEKLFNISLQQSFLAGQNYPPEWIWLAGEESRYYVLGKALPGLASWLARVIFNDPATGGVQFILSEGVYVALACATFAAWIITLSGVTAPNSSPATRRWLGVSVAVLTLLSTHAWGVCHSLRALFAQGSFNWWDLQEQVVQYTQNQYTVWLVLLGDNHAYLQALFFQVTLFGAFVLLLLLSEFSALLAVFVGISFAALRLAHTGSVAVAASVLMPSCCLIFASYVFLKSWKRARFLLWNLGLSSITAIFLLLLTARSTGETKYVFPPSEVVSSFAQFLSVQAWPLLLVVLISVSIAGKAILRFTASSLEWLGSASAWLVFLGWYTERPAVFVAVASALVVGLIVSRASISKLSESDCVVLTALVVSSFSIWVVPELIAADHVGDNRTLWIRFNMILRFWPEGYYLIPFLVITALSAATLDLLQRQIVRRVALIFTTLLVTLLLVVHGVGVRDRAARSEMKPSLDGFSFLAEALPIDNQIVSYLRGLSWENRVVLFESCGTWRYPKVRADYDWPGRIAAYSGRLGLCGWTRHAELLQPRLMNTTLGVFNTSDRNILVENLWLQLMNSSGATFPGWSAESVRNLSHNQKSCSQIQDHMRQLGVTHIVFGEWEKKTYGDVALEKIANCISGTVAFRVADLGIVKLSPLEP